MEPTDMYIFTPETLLLQAETAPSHLGYRIVTFYVDGQGLLSRTPTQNTATFYYSPSGGTLRDSDLNIVLYSAKFDEYKGFGKMS